MNPKLVNITFKTKLGTYLAEKMVVSSIELKDLEIDKNIMFRCFNDKLEGFKKNLIINHVTELPMILKVEFIKELGLGAEGKEKTKINQSI